MQHGALLLCSLLAATRQFIVLIGQKMQLTCCRDGNEMRIMRYAWTHKLQLSGPAAHFQYCDKLKVPTLRNHSSARKGVRINNIYFAIFPKVFCFCLLSEVQTHPPVKAAQCTHGSCRNITTWLIIIHQQPSHNISPITNIWSKSWMTWDIQLNEYTTKPFGKLCGNIFTGLFHFLKWKPVYMYLF